MFILPSTQLKPPVTRAHCCILSLIDYSIQKSVNQSPSSSSSFRLLSVLYADVTRTHTRTSTLIKNEPIPFTV